MDYLLTSKYKLKLIAVLLVISTINYADRLIIPVLGPMIKTEFGLNDFRYGLLGSMFVVTYVLAGLITGRLVDVYSRTTIISVAMAVWSVMTALCAGAANFWHLALSRLGVGLGEAAFLPATSSLLAEHYPKSRRSTPIAIVQLGAPIATILTATLLVWLAQATSWRVPFVVLGVVGLAAALLFRLTITEPPRGLSDAPSEHGADLAPRASFWAVTKELLKEPAFRHVLAGAALAHFALAGFGHWLPVYFSRVQGLDLAGSALTFAMVQAGASTIGLLVGGAAVDRAARHDRRAYGWVPAVALIVAAPIYAIGFTQANVVLSAVLLGVAITLLYVYYAPSLTIVQNIATARSRGVAVGLYILAANLIGSGLSSPLIGLVSDHFTTLALSSRDLVQLCGLGNAASHAAAGTMPAPCLRASADGLQTTLMWASVIPAWAAIHFYLSGKHMAKK